MQDIPLNVLSGGKCTFFEETVIGSSEQRIREAINLGNTFFIKILGMGMSVKR